MAVEMLRAITQDNFDEVAKLIKQGFDIQEISAKEHWTYLHTSLRSLRRKPSPKMLQFLIDSGLDVNLQDCYGATPLQYAVQNRHGECVRVLLENNANPNTLCEDGRTPLKSSYRGSNVDHDVIELLIKYGADVFAVGTGSIPTKDLALEQAEVRQDEKLKTIFAKY
ncbi:ankyrin repeat domain-containing protein [Thaumasiovibrio subtropicus]|uniref:ankyrin repeat domain-containing protein n=1 Tax=Thaumasiovibrio subtropicus TaxID=1891207 RepID=UPI000B35C316|nr:ankyrin repeat domain-containing protein [Thaumasiovibrio subtropicus]